MSYFEQKNSDNAISRPHLLWTIQNFHLKPLVKDGVVVAGPQWIDSLLRQVDQSNNGTSAFHSQFSEFFSSLDVKTLPYPTSNINDLGDLSSLPSAGLDPEYLKAVKALLDHILVLADPKKIGKLQMTGPALANLVEKWTENMNIPIGSYRSNSAEELLGHIMYSAPSMNSPVLLFRHV